MEFLSTAKLLLSLLPTLITMVQTVETLLPANSSGEQKLAMVETMLTSANSVATDAVAELTTVWPAIAKVVTGLVATFNATGLFHTSTPAVVASTVTAPGVAVADTSTPLSHN